MFTKIFQEERITLKRANSFLSGMHIYIDKAKIGNLQRTGFSFVNIIIVRLLFIAEFELNILLYITGIVY